MRASVFTGALLLKKGSQTTVHRRQIVSSGLIIPSLIRIFFEAINNLINEIGCGPWTYIVFLLNELVTYYYYLNMLDILVKLAFQYSNDHLCKEFHLVYLVINN